MRYLVILFLVLSYIPSKAQEIANKINIHISDINFELALIKKGLDSGKPDGKVWLSDIENVEVLDLSWNRPSVSNLSGIEYFKNLKHLALVDHNLSELDVSHNIKLESLSIGGNDEISELDLSKNIALKELYLYDHDAGSSSITSIYLSNNINLNTLYLDSYVIESIDLSHNTALVELRCKAPWNFTENKGFETLDLSKNTQLKKLDCSGNQLETLDLSHNLKLESLACSYNKLTELNIDKNSQLESVSCSNNNIQSLNCNQNNRLKDLFCSKSLTKCLAVLPITSVYYHEDYRMIEAANIPEVLDEDCTK